MQSRDYAASGRSLVGSSGFTLSRPYGLPQRVLSLYAAETVIEMDVDEVVISVGDN